MEKHNKYVQAYYQAYSRAETARSTLERGDAVPLSWLEEICQSIDLMDANRNVVEYTR
jgi:hypothetical protein